MTAALHQREREAVLTALHDEQTVTVGDGRTIAYAEFGDPGGTPVLYLHGAGSSRLEGAVFDAETRSARVRVIAPDRPGCGGSSPRPGRTVMAFAEDLRELCESLAVSSAVVAGMSNGGMYALAAAAALPDLITAAVPINASTPLHDPVARAVTPAAVRLQYGLLRHGAPAMAWVARRRGARVEATTVAARAAREALRQPGSPYLREEMMLAVRPWGFDHTAIAQPVELFSGDRDPGVAYAREWVRRLPDARLHLFAGGHGAFVEPEARRQVVATLQAVAS